MRLIVLGTALLTAACGASEASDPVDSQGLLPPLPRPLPAIERVRLTTEVVLAPTHARGPDLGNPALPEFLPPYVKLGYGELAALPGEPHTGHTLDGSPVPAMGKNARRLLRFAHLGDLQLVDDESPTRVGFLDAHDVTDASLRPQEAYQCRLTNAAVRTLNALHRQDPLAFVLAGGDLLDNAQGNEARWALQILGGAPRVECDSGEDDDLIPGPDNDPKDPFIAEGLAMPWKWVSGNHDVLAQGNLRIDDEVRAMAVGDSAVLGTRDYRQGGAIVRGPLIADPSRTPLSGQELMTRVAQHGDGHGIGPEQIRRGKAYYSFDVAGTPLRFLVLDTNAETGGSDGLLRRSDLDAYVRPALESARQQGKWVTLVSDHPGGTLTPDGGRYGTVQPDAVLEGEWQALLGGYPQVLFSMVPKYTQGARPIKLPSGHAYWEIANGGLSDVPVQFRLFEVWDGDNGYLMLRATCVDPVLDGDPVAEEGRRRAIIDMTSTWKADPTSPRETRNAELWIRKPA